MASGWAKADERDSPVCKDAAVILFSRVVFLLYQVLPSLHQVCD